MLPTPAEDAADRRKDTSSAEKADQETMRPAFERLLSRKPPPAGCHITAAALHPENGQIVSIDDDNIGGVDPDASQKNASRTRPNPAETVAHLAETAPQKGSHHRAIAVSRTRLTLNVSTKTILIGRCGSAAGAVLIYTTGVLPEINPLSATGAAAVSIGQTMAQARLAERAAQKTASQPFALHSPAIVASAPRI